MNIALRVAAGLLALVFCGAGAAKIAQSKEKLTASASMAWAKDFSPGVIKAIGFLEVLGAIGLVLPATVDIAPVLVPVAATGLVLTMVGAAITHARRKEAQPIVMNVILLALAVFVAWGRFGSHTF